MRSVQLFEGFYEIDVDTDHRGNVVVGKVYTEPKEENGPTEVITVEEMARREGATVAAVMEMIDEELRDEACREDERRVEEQWGR